MSTPWRWRQRSARLFSRLPPMAAGDALGDLYREYQAHLARTGRLRAEWWLCRQMWSLTRAYARYEPRRRSLISALRAGEAGQVIRSLARSPWYATTALAVIALSTALGTAIFAIVDGALFKPLPYHDPSRLFAVALGFSRLSEPLAPMRPVSPAAVAGWRAALPDLTFTAFDTSGLQTVGRQDNVRRADVDPFFFDALGVRPMVGGFSAEDFQSTTAIRPALVTMAFWRDRFGDAAPATGQVLTDEAGRGIRIAGVLPETFLFPQASRATLTPRVLVPLVRDPASQGNSLRVLVRIAPGVDPVSAAARVNAAVAAQAAARPSPALPRDLDARARIVREGVDRGGLESIDSALRSSSRRRAWVVFTAVATLVLLACFNVTGLAIARTHERHRDLAVRRALGASTRDLVRLLAIESVAVVTTGTIAGLLLAWWALPLGVRLFAGDFMLTLKPAVIDGRVAAFAALLALAGSLVVILLAARSVGRTGLRPRLAEGAGGTWRARKTLSIMSFEIAAAYLITVVAALVVGSLIRAWSEDTGFDVPDAAVLRMSPPPGASAPEIEQILLDIGRIPGVQAVGGIAHPFLQQAFNGSVFDSPPGRTIQEGPAMPFPIESVPVTHGVFPTLGLTPQDGRLPTADEFNSGAPLIVVTETVAREYWPGQRAVGETLIKDDRPFEVIGVVGDLRLLSLDLARQGGIFWPVAAMPEPRLSNVVLKFAHDAAVDVHQVAATVRARCPDCWMRESLTIEEALAESIRPRRFSAWLFGGFGLAALAIAGTGILGVVAMTTTRRVREIGIRMALGASRSGVLALLMREQLVTVVVGLVMGGVAATWASTFLASYLYRTEAGDPVSWSAAAAAMLLVACIGAFVPARRASRTDPAQTLRAE